MAWVGDLVLTSEPVAPKLLVITGASHTGKTSVAEALLGRVPPPAAYLSVDTILQITLTQPPGSVWGQIPLAYELMRLQAKALIGKGWLVVAESTFTYVPTTGTPQLHLDELRRLVLSAEDQRVSSTVVQLSAPAEQLAERARKTGRLAPDIVAKTARLHEATNLLDGTLRLDSGAQTAEGLASQILRGLKASD